MYWGRRKGGGAWRHAFNAADPPSSNELVIRIKCHHVKFSTRMSAWAYYVASVKKSLYSRRVRVKAKRTPTGVTPASAKSSKDISQENVPRPTGEEQPNRFARRSLKFTVCVILLVYIASYNKRSRRNVEKCVSLASYATDYSVWVYSCCWICCPFCK